MTHTPDPWILSKSKTSVNIGNSIRLVQKTGAGGAGSCSQQQAFNDMMVANATLIAAAPTLLKACQMFLNVWLSGETDFSSDRALKVGAIIKDAVAKAIGEQA